MAKVMRFVEKYYPEFLSDLQTYGIDEARERHIDILPSIQRNVIKFCKAKQITLNLI